MDPILRIPGRAPGAPTRQHAHAQNHSVPESPALHPLHWKRSQGEHQSPFQCCNTTNTSSVCCASSSNVGGTPLSKACSSPLVPGQHRRYAPLQTMPRGSWQWPRASSAEGGAVEEGRGRGSSGLDSDASDARGGDVTGESGGRVGVQEGAGGGTELVARLKACGIAGVIAYGILNTAYYLSAFLIMVLRVSPLEKGAGVLAAARHCAMLLTLVWAGSQVTKIPRMLCALMITPWVERILQWLTSSNRVKSKSRALVIAATLCFGSAVLIFAAIILMWS